VPSDRRTGSAAGNGADPGADAAFCARVLAVHGPGARTWLDELASIVDRWRRHWSLGPPRPYPHRYHWVAAVDRDDGAPCVLKLAPPGAREPVIEARWLTRVGGRGAVGLLDCVPGEGALLLERIEPGSPLAALVPDQDERACEVLAAVAAAIRRPADSADKLPTLADRVAELGRYQRTRPHDPLPAGMVAAAERTATDLLRTAPADVLLHADLHHDNVLWDRERGWLAIDPHGLVGDPAYEFAPLLYNPLPPVPAVADLALRRCVHLAAASGIALERIRGWGFVQAVLSAVWSLEEDPVPDAHVLAVAARLRAG
jgi:streptomycin 6-kinase